MTLEPGPGFHALNIGFNDEMGHCLINRIEKDKIYIYKYPEKNKRSFPEYVDAIGANLKVNEVYNITLEVMGSKVFLHINDQHFSWENIQDLKTLKQDYFFTFHGGRGKIHDIKLWQGKALEASQEDKWLQQKNQRLPLNLDNDPSFKSKKLIADARVSLKTDAGLSIKISGYNGETSLY